MYNTTERAVTIARLGNNCGIVVGINAITKKLFIVTDSAASAADRRSLKSYIKTYNSHIKE